MNTKKLNNIESFLQHHNLVDNGVLFDLSMRDEDIKDDTEFKYGELKHIGYIKYLNYLIPVIMSDKKKYRIGCSLCLINRYRRGQFIVIGRDMIENLSHEEVAILLSSEIPYIIMGQFAMTIMGEHIGIRFSLSHGMDIEKAYVNMYEGTVNRIKKFSANVDKELEKFENQFLPVEVVKNVIADFSDSPTIEECDLPVPNIEYYRLTDNGDIHLVWRLNEDDIH